jgi:hypothetical protein
LLTPKR